MYIVHHAHLDAQRSDGELHYAAADRRLGIAGFEIWMHRLEPGARGAEMMHQGELAVLVLAGCGKLLIDGGPQRFAAPCTVLPPAQRPFRFVNDGAECLQLVAVCTLRPQCCTAGEPGDGPSAPPPLAPSGDAAMHRDGNTAGHAASPRQPFLDPSPGAES